MAGCVKKKKEKKRKKINHPSKARTEPKVIFSPLNTSLDTLTSLKIVFMFQNS